MQVGRERLIAVALVAAQLVVQMGDGQREGGGRVAHCEQCVQQCHAVRPAGNGGHDAAGVVFQGPQPAAHAIHQPARHTPPPPTLPARQRNSGRLRSRLAKRHHPFITTLMQRRRLGLPDWLLDALDPLRPAGSAAPAGAGRPGMAGRFDCRRRGALCRLDRLRPSRTARRQHRPHLHRLRRPVAHGPDAGAAARASTFITGRISARCFRTPMLPPTPKPYSTG